MFAAAQAQNAAAVRPARDSGAGHRVPCPALPCRKHFHFGADAVAMLFVPLSLISTQWPAFVVTLCSSVPRAPRFTWKAFDFASFRSRRNRLRAKWCARSEQGRLARDQQTCRRRVREERVFLRDQMDQAAVER